MPSAVIIYCNTNIIILLERSEAGGLGACPHEKKISWLSWGTPVLHTRFRLVSTNLFNFLNSSLSVTSQLAIYLVASTSSSHPSYFTSPLSPYVLMLHFACLICAHPLSIQYNTIQYNTTQHNTHAHLTLTLYSGLHFFPRIFVELLAQFIHSFRSDLQSWHVWKPKHLFSLPFHIPFSPIPPPPPPNPLIPRNPRPQDTDHHQVLLSHLLVHKHKCKR